MKTLVENAQITFRQQLASLQAITGLDNKGLAELLGCDVATVSHLRNRPLTVSGRYILLVQEHLRREEMRRY